MEEKYNQIVADKSMTAREYFIALRLAILHVDHKYIDTSFGVTQYPKTKEIYECACKIARAL